MKFCYANIFFTVFVEVAPEIFKNGGKCESCTPKDNRILRKFLSSLQRKQPTEYKHLIQGLQNV